MFKYDLVLSDLKILVYNTFHLLHTNKCQFLKVIVAYRFNILKKKDIRLYSLLYLKIMVEKIII